MSDFSTIILSEQEWRGEIYNFDPDSSPKAWEFYKVIYSPQLWPFWNEFDFDIEKFKRTYVNKNGEKINRLHCGLKTDSKYFDNDSIGKLFKFSGDCSFNFNEIKCERFQNLLGKKTKSYCKNAKTITIR